MQNATVTLFEKQMIRSIWNEEIEEWYLSLVDVIQVLTDSANPTDYLKKIRKRDVLLGDYIGTNCPQIKMLTETGKLRESEGFLESQSVAIDGAKVAKEARNNIEAKTGQSTVSSKNAKSIHGRMDNVLQLPENE